MDVKTETIISEHELEAGFGHIGAPVRGEAAQDLAEQVERYRVRVDSTLPCGCIDGRPCVHTMDGGETQPRPKVAGGPLVTGYAAAELVGLFGDDETTALQRIEHLAALFAPQGITPGAHGDSGNFVENFKKKTGCGAADKLPEILQVLADNFGAIAEMRSGVLGEENVSVQYQSIASMQRTLSTWRSQDVIDVTKSKDESNVEILESDDTPTHGHRESLVIFNYTENTTIDRDALAKETGQQVFVIDMWYLKKMAKALATGPDATAQSAPLLRAMVDYQLATYLTLCDGTQRAVFLDKQENYALAA